MGFPSTVTPVVTVTPTSLPPPQENIIKLQQHEETGYGWNDLVASGMIEYVDTEVRRGVGGGHPASVASCDPPSSVLLVSLPSPPL